MVARSTALSGAGAMGPDVVVVVGSSATIEHVYEFVDKTYEEKVKDVEWNVKGTPEEGETVDINGFGWNCRPK